MAGRLDTCRRSRFREQFADTPHRLRVRPNVRDDASLSRVWQGQRAPCDQVLSRSRRIVASRGGKRRARGGWKAAGKMTMTTYAGEDEQGGQGGCVVG